MDDGATVIGVFNARAEFRGKERVGYEFGLRGMRGRTTSGCSHVATFAALVTEGVNLVRRKFLDRLIPGPVGVAAEHRQHLARRKHGAVPSRDRVERSIE